MSFAALRNRTALTCSAILESILAFGFHADTLFRLINDANNSKPLQVFGLSHGPTTFETRRVLGHSRE